MEAKVEVGHSPKKVTCKTNCCVQACRVDNIICYFYRGNFGTRCRVYIYVTKSGLTSTSPYQTNKQVPLLYFSISFYFNVVKNITKFTIITILKCII